MEKTNENYNELISKFALVCDAIETICPDGNGTVVYELKKERFEKFQKLLTKNKKGTDKFILNFSGINVVFILDES